MENTRTYTSVRKWLRDIAAWVMRLAEQGGSPQTVRAALADVSFRLWRAPGLSCEIRLSDKPPPSLLLLTFRQQPADSALETELRRLTLQLPALEPPLRELYDDEATWQEAYKAHIQARCAWIFAHPDDPGGAYHHACARRAQLQAMLTEQRKACREFTVEVGLEGRPQRFPAHLVKAFRASDTWRFKPERRSPLEELLVHRRKRIERLQAQGKWHEAAAMEASTQRLAANMEQLPDKVKQERRERRAWRRKPLWISPGETTLESVQFQLVLYLSQEGMIDASSPELSRFIGRYMKRFQHVITQEERDLLDKRFWFQGGGSGFTALERAFAYPEDWRALNQYIAKTLRGRYATEVRKAVEDAQHLSPLDPKVAEEVQRQTHQGRPRRSKRPMSLDNDQDYSVDQVVRILRVEAHDGERPQDRATVYRWIKAEKILVILDTCRRKRLNSEGLEQVRAIVAAKRQQKALVERARAVGMTDDAIIKARQRGTLEAIITRKEAERKPGGER